MTQLSPPEVLPAPSHVPKRAVQVGKMLAYFVMVIVGGRSVSGAVIGAAAIAVLNEFLRRGENSIERFGLSTMVLAAIFVAMMILRSEGLLGRWELDELIARWARRARGGGGHAFGSRQSEPPAARSGPPIEAPP